MRLQIRRCLALAALLLAGVLTSARADAPRYKLTVIGGPDSETQAFAINNQGAVVGWLYTPDGYRSFVYRNGRRRMLPLLPEYTRSYAAGINDRGDIAGSMGRLYFDGAQYVELATAFVLKAGVLTDLGKELGLGGGAIDINNQAEVLLVESGVDSTGLQVIRASYVYGAGALNRLPIVAAQCPNVWARGINERGQVTGTSVVNDFGANPCGPAFVFGSGQVRTLDDPAESLADHSIGLAINNAGHVAGYRHDAAGTRRPVLYRGGNIVYLSARSGVANAINRSGQVVGSLRIAPPSFDTHAFIHTGGRTYDLNALTLLRRGFVLREATAINDAGQIVGIGGQTGKAQTRAYLLTPIRTQPEAEAGGDIKQLFGQQP